MKKQESIAELVSAVKSNLTWTAPRILFQLTPPYTCTIIQHFLMLNSWLFIPVFLFLWIPGISKFLSRPWPSRGKSFKVRGKFITFFRWIVQKCWVLTTENWHVKTQTFQMLTEWRLLCNFEWETSFRENSSYLQSCQWSTKNRPRWFFSLFFSMVNCIIFLTITNWNIFYVFRALWIKFLFEWQRQYFIASSLFQNLFSHTFLMIGLE